MIILDQITNNFIKDHELEDIRNLALQANRYPQIDMPFAIQQIAGRQTAKNKIPTWYASENVMYPPHLSLEQCSSEKTARYKASLCKGNHLVDLTGGMGIDFFFMSQNFDVATYVEQQDELVKLAKHNFGVLGLQQAKVVLADAESYLKTMDRVNTIYIDPARRSASGKKTVFIEDCTPNIVEIEDLLEEKAEQVIIKLSPMLDISLALKSLKSVSDVHIVSHENECKELFFVNDKKRSGVVFHCVNIFNNGTSDVFTYAKNEDDLCLPNYTNQVEEFLYEPNVSILKAGARSVAKKFSLNKLHPNSNLYTSSLLKNDFPGRKFKVVYVFAPNKKNIKLYLSAISKANITVRNFPMSVEELRKRTGLKDGGDTYLFATTLQDEQKVILLCEKTDRLKKE